MHRITCQAISQLASLHSSTANTCGGQAIDAHFAELPHDMAQPPGADNGLHSQW